MLIWKVCRPLINPQASSGLLHLRNWSQLVRTAKLTTLLSHCDFAPSRQAWRDNGLLGQRDGCRAPQICAASKKKREFHSSPSAPGYKSGPRRPSWKYVNIQTKDPPKPVKGSRLPRFYVSSEVVSNAHQGSVFQLSEGETKHALRSLRLAEGDWLEVCDGKGLLVEARMRGLTFSNRAFATASSEPIKVPWAGPHWEVVVALGGLQGNRADNLVEKISELGARSLRPLLTNRSRTIGRFESKDTIRVVEVEELSDMSDVEEEDDFMRTGRFGRWERVSTSAGKQSLRTHSLLIRPPAILDQLVTQIKAGAPAFVAAQGAPPLQVVLSEHTSSLLEAEKSEAPRPCLLLVGPEGDFTEQEMKELTEAGAKPVGLGQNRLRVETAAMAFTAGAVLHWESFKHREKAQPVAEQQELAA